MENKLEKYTFKLWFKAISAITALIILQAIAFDFLDSYELEHSLRYLLDNWVSILATIFFTYLALNTMSTQYYLSANSLIYKSLFREKEFKIADITSVEIKQYLLKPGSSIIIHFKRMRTHRIYGILVNQNSFIDEIRNARNSIDDRWLFTETTDRAV